MIATHYKDLVLIVLVSILILSKRSLPTWAEDQAEMKELYFQGNYYDSQEYAVHLARSVLSFVGLFASYGSIQQLFHQIFWAGLHSCWLQPKRITTDSTAKYSKNIVEYN